MVKIFKLKKLQKLLKGSSLTSPLVWGVYQYGLVNVGAGADSNWDLYGSCINDWVLGLAKGSNKPS